MSRFSLFKLLSMVLFILCLMAYFMFPAEGHLILSNITDLFSSVSMNQTSTPLNNADLNNFLGDTYQIMDTQISETGATSSTPQDMFHGVLKAVPGTFMKMVQQWYLRMLSSTTTPSTWTTAATSSSSTATNAANTIGMGTALSGFLFMSWVVGTIISGWK